MAMFLIMLVLCTPVFKWIGVGIGYVVAFPIVLLILGAKALVRRTVADFRGKDGGGK
ncbi:hypothetical protein [Agrobacterium tumefaciens]|uniref:hypothetical protein n=1 Tax=Agrobacterium tumefaciens TaxID=358 RepID=UPI001573B898|nr:hypothetical protein [Agrobacterium tumefaciens]NTB05923.1 hypothetical protein [Agrobacterium tumefaciens]